MPVLLDEIDVRTRDLAPDEQLELARRLLNRIAPPTPGTAEERRGMLRRRFLARLERGVDFGSAPLPRREELYAAD